MHTARSPSTIPTDVPRDAQDLILSGSQFSLSKRPSSASPGKYFSRSVSVTVASDSRGKRNTLSDGSNGGSRSIKNLRRSNSTTQVNQQANTSLSQEPSEDYLSLFDSSIDGRKKLASISKASPDRTTWNVLDDQPRSFPLHSSSHSIGGVDPPPCHNKREPGITLAATFTANNRSNKGAVGNSVTTILHNNYSEKPLTPKSSNQKPSFNNILKATANDEVSLEGGSLTKSQKNFSSVSSTSNNRSPVSALRGSPVLFRRREASEEEAERFIQQVNQAAVTIQRWYRHHAKRQCTNRAVLKQILASKRKEWEERTEEDSYQEQLQKKDEERKRIREEKSHLAHLAAIQELQQQRAQQVVEMHLAARVEVECPRQTGVVRRKKLSKICPTNRGPASPAKKKNPTSPTDIKSKNTETNLNVTSEVSELSFRAISPALSNNRVSQCSQDHEDRTQAEICLEVQDPENDRKMTRKEKARLAGLAATQELQQRRTQQAADVQHGAAVELINIRQTDVIERKKPPKISPINRSPASPSHDSPMSPTDAKAKNTDSNLNIAVELGELATFRAVSPALSKCRGSQCSQEILQRSVSVEDPRQGALSSRPQSKTTLTELLDSLKLLEEEPENLVEPKSSHKEKYAWIDEDDSNSLTTDNLERHGQMSHHPELPDCGALLSEAKLQSIMNFLDEMEKSEQERPRSVTSGSHREAVLSEEELIGVEQTSATAAEVTGSMMRIKLELEEKKRAVNKLQTALARQRELTARHVNETKKELSRDLHLQKEHYEATIQRHLALIDQLFNDKQALSERCERLAAELRQVNQKYNKMIAQMQEQHEMVWQILGPLCEEIKKLKELMSASEKIRKEKWIDEKTKKIKEITVKGLEPEIQKLISRHKQELKKQRTLHEAELLQADDRAAQRYMRQCEDLRQQLEKEKEEQCQKERELSKQRYDQQLQEEALSLQQQRRRLYKEVADEKERMAQLAERQRAELDDLRRQMEENSSLAGRALREELEKIREEQERRHQSEIKAMQERLDIEKQSWEENYKKKEEVWLLSRERQLKEDLRRERDKEIELAIWTLEEETNKDKEECERAADNRLKRLREKYEAELKELQHSERSAVEKQHEMRKQHIEMEAELLQLRSLIRQRDEENEDISRTRDKLVGERHSLAEVIRLEFAERLVMTEEENRKMKMEVSEVRAKLRIEVERVTKEKEEEVSELLKRVKAAVVKKEETVNSLKKQYEAALKRADHLEALWEQQRKQLLQK